MRWQVQTGGKMSSPGFLCFVFSLFLVLEFVGFSKDTSNKCVFPFGSPLKPTEKGGSPNEGSPNNQFQVQTPAVRNIDKFLATAAGWL